MTARRRSSQAAEALRAERRREGSDAPIGAHDLDLSHAGSVLAFAQWYEQDRGRRLDVLVNNGGIHLDLMSKWKEPKLALVHFTYEAQRRFAGPNHLQSYCQHPGGVSGARTNIADKGLEGSRIVGWLRKAGAPLESLFMATAEEGAQTQTHCATAPGAVGGRCYLDCRAGEAGPDVEDEVAAERLWKEIAEWVGTLPAGGEHL